MENLKFSIIIPVYNSEQYLDKCVESVLNQKYSNFEILLIDDGSQDSSGILCDSWAEKNHRVRVIHQHNCGAAGARNTGIRNASGDYIQFLDSDDWWVSEDVLQKIAHRLSLNNVDVLSYNYRKSYSGKMSPACLGEDENNPTEADEIFAYLTHRNMWTTSSCNKAIRRSLFEDGDLYFKEGITSEDIDWTMRLAIKAQKFDYCNLVVFIYQQRENSVSHSLSFNAVACLCGNVEECVRLLEAAEPEKAHSLNSFVSYQYATLLHNYARLKESERIPPLDDRVRAMLPLLKASSNPKVRLMRVCNAIFGFNATLLFLRARQKLINCLGRI